MAKTVFITGASSGLGTVPRLPWTLIAPLLRVIPTSMLVRGAPERDFASKP